MFLRFWVVICWCVILMRCGVLKVVWWEVLVNVVCVLVVLLLVSWVLV